MENLEKYIVGHRDELDSVEALNVEKIWLGVSQQPAVSSRQSTLCPKDSLWDGLAVNKKKWVWAVAASVLLLIGFGLGYLVGDDKTEEPLYSLKDISPQLAEQEAEFIQLISQKEAEIDIQNLEKETFKDIFEELELLDEIHKEFRKDIPQFSQNDQLVSTLIRYYEQKIRILERLSNEIEKHKNHEIRM